MNRCEPAPAHHCSQGFQSTSKLPWCFKSLPSDQQLSAELPRNKIPHPQKSGLLVDTSQPPARANCPEPPLGLSHSPHTPWHWSLHTPETHLGTAHTSPPDTILVQPHDLLRFPRGRAQVCCSARLRPSLGPWGHVRPHPWVLRTTIPKSTELKVTLPDKGTQYHSDAVWAL